MAESNKTSTQQWFEQLFEEFGFSFPTISKARQAGDDKCQQIAQALDAAGLTLGNETSLVVFGSLARREFTSGSDVDWTLLVDGRVDPQHYQLAIRIRDVFVTAGFAEPGSTGIFGTLANSYDLVHHIGGMEDTNRNLTRRLLMILESRAVKNDNVRIRVLRAILNRYIVHGYGLPDEHAGAIRVPRFLLNDIVRCWRTMTVDYAAKKWEQPNDKWALRNAKLRVSRKMIFVKGLLLCFDCELFPQLDPWDALNSVGAGSSETAAERLVAGCEKLAQLTPIDLLSRAILHFSLREAAKGIFTKYNEFLSLIDDKTNRDRLKQLKDFDAASQDDVFQRARTIGRSFSGELEDLFFQGPSELSALTKKYGLF